MEAAEQIVYTDTGVQWGRGAGNVRAMKFLNRLKLWAEDPPWPWEYRRITQQPMCPCFLGGHNSKTLMSRV
jgi:hypothetical protein